MLNTWLQSSSSTATSWLNVSNVLAMCLATFKIVDWMQCRLLSFLLVLAFSYWLGFVLYRWLMRDLLAYTVASYKKAVLVTCGDSECGFRLVKALAGRGFQVLAGCRDKNSAQASKLTTIPNVTLLGLDVANQESCQTALESTSEMLTETGNVLWCVVCNTEEASVGELEWHGMESIKEIFDVNVTGAIRIVKTFLPLLRETKGRIVLSSSVTSTLSVPGLLAYSMSKASVASLAEGLKRELKLWDIDVCTVQSTLVSPYDIVARKEHFMNTEMHTLPEGIRRDYGSEYFQSFWRTYTGFLEKHATPTLEQEVDTFEHAVSTVWPETHLRASRWHQVLLQNILNFMPIEATDEVLARALKNPVLPHALVKREVLTK